MQPRIDGNTGASIAAAWWPAVQRRVGRNSLCAELGSTPVLLQKSVWRCKKEIFHKLHQSITLTFQPTRQPGYRQTNQPTANQPRAGLVCAAAGLCARGGCALPTAAEDRARPAAGPHSRQPGNQEESPLLSRPRQSTSVVLLEGRGYSYQKSLVYNLSRNWKKWPASAMQIKSIYKFTNMRIL